MVNVNLKVLSTVAVTFLPFVAAVASQKYTWKNVKIGGGGGFVPGIVFNTKQKVLIHPVSGSFYLLKSHSRVLPLLGLTLVEHTS